MMPGWLKFVLSYVAGVFGLWGGLGLSATNAFGGAVGGLSIFSLYVAPLLVGICVFALVYMALTRRALRLGFWALALVLSGGVAVLTLSLILQGVVTPLEGGVIGLAVHFWASFFLMRRSLGRVF